MENVKNFINSVRSNLYIRQPVYDPTVRVKQRGYEAYILGAIAVTPFLVGLTLGIAEKFW